MQIAQATFPVSTPRQGILPGGCVVPSPKPEDGCCAPGATCPEHPSQPSQPCLPAPLSFDKVDDPMEAALLPGLDTAALAGAAAAAIVGILPLLLNSMMGLMGGQDQQIPKIRLQVEGTLGVEKTPVNYGVDFNPSNPDTSSIPFDGSFGNAPVSLTLSDTSDGRFNRTGGSGTISGKVGSSDVSLKLTASQDGASLAGAAGDVPVSLSYTVAEDKNGLAISGTLGDATVSQKLELTPEAGGTLGSFASIFGNGSGNQSPAPGNGDSGEPSFPLPLARLSGRVGGAIDSRTISLNEDLSVQVQGSLGWIPVDEKIQLLMSQP